ncbi:hypothetical protein X474_06190 [Dethiosulfatarculus sandiegensis]|uniref:Uncharacterized protein n=1 Tax=Dethiosulfatarculus sandiegensis TaxID=1429043 RepID=A0A0D2GIT9_9BACT|nr:hypothetical protein X474_06190 [Dethiosulfatarculus sandiegensis]
MGSAAQNRVKLKGCFLSFPMVVFPVGPFC